MQHSSPSSINRSSHPVDLSLERHFGEFLPVAAALVDQDFHYLITSQQWLKEFALEGNDLRGQSHLEVFPNLSDRLIQAYQRCLTDGVELWLEESFPFSEDKIGWRRWKINSWKNETGKIGGLMLVVEDISVSKQTEEALRVSESRFRETAKNLPGAIFQFTVRQGIWGVDYISEKMGTLCSGWEVALILMIKSKLKRFYSDRAAWRKPYRRWN